MSEKVHQLAPQILETIKQSNSILLHLHPSPDGDSAGGALGLMHILQAMGKKATVIGGDSKLPINLQILPGADQIILKNYGETDLSKFDLFIIMDSSTKEMVSRLEEVKFPDHLKTIVIDHHSSNLGFGQLNLVDSNYPANAQLIFDVVSNWGVEISKEAAACLLVGIYSDSLFKFSGVTSETFEAASALAKINPDFPKLIAKMEATKEPAQLRFEALALNSIQNYFDDKVAIIEIPYHKLKELKIDSQYTEKSGMSSHLIEVVGWEIGISFVEKEPNMIAISMRTQDSEKYDLSKLATSIGGGGHKGAAGAMLTKPFEESKKELLAAIEKTLFSVTGQ